MSIPRVNTIAHVQPQWPSSDQAIWSQILSSHTLQNCLSHCTQSLQVGEEERQMQKIHSRYRLQKGYVSQKFRETQITGPVEHPLASITLQGQNGHIRVHPRPLPKPRSSPSITHPCGGVLLRSWQWVLPPLMVLPPLAVCPSAHLVTRKNSPQEKTPSSLLGSSKTLSPHGNMTLSFARIKPHESKHFLELS